MVDVSRWDNNGDYNNKLIIVMVDVGGWDNDDDDDD